MKKDVYEWAIEDIYQNEDEWAKDFEKVSSLLDFSEFKGKLGDKETFKACMKKKERVTRLIEKLGLYSMMKHDMDTADASADALESKITSVCAKYSQSLAFLTPELTALPEEVLSGYVSSPDLKEYDYTLKCLIEQKSHVLGEKEEEILALVSETTSSFRDIFTKTDNADLPLPVVKHKGESYRLSHGLYGALMQDKDRSLRKKVFKSYYGAYKSLINTISATYVGSVRKDAFYSKARKYDSSLDMALSDEDVKEDVYRTLVSSVRKALPLLHRYVALKKKFLGLKEMHMYDMYVPVCDDDGFKLKYDDAYDLVLKGLAPLGKEYGELLTRAKNERWISVYEKKGKRSGAYSCGVFDTHPFVLLNYTETTHDIFTIAHEMGHSIHTYFSNRTQPYAKADYRIFVAEVASTVNEVLLVKYLLSQAKDKNAKKYLLCYLAEMIRTTLFRQTQFSEFEEFSHSAQEQGVPLTKENLSEKYYELNKEYYGDAVISDDEIKYEWARIPHFYRAFYVYKYATGITSALAIAGRILEEGEPAVKDYFKFLSSGSSDDPVSLLKIAGVDLTDEKTFENAFSIFADALAQMEKL